jgi:hypothetical protein
MYHFFSDRHGLISYLSEQTFAQESAVAKGDNIKKTRPDKSQTGFFYAGCTWLFLIRILCCAL